MTKICVIEFNKGPKPVVTTVETSESNDFPRSALLRFKNQL